MNCPNCRKKIVEDRAGKIRCTDCGWFEPVDGGWQTCEEPAKPEAKKEPVKEVQAVQGSQTTKEKKPLIEIEFDDGDDE